MTNLSFRRSPYLMLNFPGSSTVKHLPTMRETRFNPWVGKILWRTRWQPTAVLLPGKSHGWRSVVGYSLWGLKQSDTTERCRHSSQRERKPRSSLSTLYSVKSQIGTVPSDTCLSCHFTTLKLLGSFAPLSQYFCT